MRGRGYPRGPGGYLGEGLCPNIEMFMELYDVTLEEIAADRGCTTDQLNEQIKDDGYGNSTWGCIELKLSQPFKKRLAQS